VSDELKAELKLLRTKHSRAIAKIKILEQAIESYTGLSRGDIAFIKLLLIAKGGKTATAIAEKLIVPVAIDKPKPKSGNTANKKPIRPKAYRTPPDYPPRKV
jgi:hypothetical protein